MKKVNGLTLALAMAFTFAGATHSANAANPGVSKTITLTAQINDSIFVSKPDGSTWYNTEELEADDHKQKHFSKVLPVRVLTKSADFNISLAQPLKMSSGKFEMLNPKVTLSSSTGDQEVKFAAQTKITQVTATDDGFDGVYDLKIDVDAPARGAEGVDGSYTGDLVMLFEPSAASEATP